MAQHRRSKSAPHARRTGSLSPGHVAAGTARPLLGQHKTAKRELGRGLRRLRFSHAFAFPSVGGVVVQSDGLVVVRRKCWIPLLSEGRNT